MLKPTEFIDAYANTGAAKCAGSVKKLLLLSLLSGFVLGTAGTAASTASFAFENVSAAKLINAFIFAFGLIVIIYTGAELFTGNCLIAISVLEKRVTALSMLRNLALVYLGNFIGCALVAWCCAATLRFDAGGGLLAVSTIKTAAAKCSLSFSNAFILGIFCNALVCLGVVCGVTAKSAAGKAVGAYLPVCIFVICGFEHSIANMYYIPAGLFANSVPAYAEAAAMAGVDTAALTWANFAVRNLIPVTLGNIVGGAGLGALLWGANHGGKETK